MAKPNLSNQAAEDTVFGNLGMSREDLGIGTDEDLGSGNEDLGQEGSGNDDLGQDDQGSGANGQDREQRQQQRGVTHTRQQQQERRIPAGAEVKPDGKGNLVAADGTIVARAGKEARLYQDLHKTRGQAQTLQGQVSEVTGRLHKAVEIGQQLHRDLLVARQHNDAVKQFGLDQSEHLTALRLFKELRDNPKDAIKNILTRAAANGINIAELGSAAGGVDPKSLLDLIRQEIGTAVNPLRQRTEAEQRQAAQTAQLQQREQEVQAEVKSFFDSNPEAKAYVPVFTQTIKQFPGMTLGEVWARIQLHFARNPQDRRSQNSSNRRSLPSGRPAAPAMGLPEDLAPVTDSYDTIVRAALDGANIR